MSREWEWHFFVIRGVEIALASVVPAMNGFIESFGSHARFLVDSIYAMRNQEHPGLRTYIILPDCTRGDRKDAANRLRQNAHGMGVIRVELHKQLLFRDWEGERRWRGV